SRAIREVLEELHRLRVGVVHEAGVDIHQQQMIGAIARPERELASEGSVHEQRHRENYYRDSDLTADEKNTSPAAPASRSDAVAGLHNRRQIRPRGVKRRSEAEEQGARKRDQQAEDERAAIHLESERDREIRRNLDLPKQQHARVSDTETDYAASDGNEQALR